MKHLILGLLLAALVLHPALALLLAAPLGTAALWALAQPVVWAFTAGIITRPHIARRLARGAR